MRLPLLFSANIGNSDSSSKRASIGLARRCQEGHKMRTMRELSGWTQAELGRRAELSAQQVSNIERGRRGIGPDIGPRLAKAFDLSEKEFRRLLSEDDAGQFTNLWLELHHTPGAEELTECFCQILKIKKAIDANKASPDTLDHLKRQIELLARLTGVLEIT